MPSIALATCAEQSTLYYDEAPLVKALENKDFVVFPTVWNSPEIDWQSYDVILLRNTWDYHQQISAFQAWLDYLDKKNSHVLNPTALIRWNMDKSYLRQLAEKGIKTLPTIFAKGRNIQLETIFRENNWSEAVVKPLISGSGDNTWTISAETAAASQQKFDWLNQAIGMMIQPLAEQIYREGEYSLVFYAGDYSHTVLKKPSQDSIFVQQELGGTVETIEASENLVSQAKYAVQATQAITGIMPTYARVDGLYDSTDFVLMEFECIEPEMYFTRSAHAAERFVAVILEAIS